MTVRFSSAGPTVRQAIGETEEQTGKFFGYSDRLDRSRTLRFERPEVPLDTVLARIAGTEFAVKRSGDYILLFDRALADPTGRISGRMIDAATGEPLGGWITLSDTIRLWVDRSGYFRTGEIPEGEYLARITAEGYRPAYRLWTTAGETDYRHTVGLIAPDTTVADTVSVPLLVVERPRPDFAEWLLSRRAPEEPPAPLDLSDYRAFIPAPPAAGEPRWAVKTNALGWVAGALNAAVERKLKPHWSAEFSALARPRAGDPERSFRFWLVQPEVRYWFTDAFERHFVGLHADFGEYRIGNRDLGIPLLRDNTVDGSVWGLGASYGYHLPLGARWGAEGTIGVGYLALRYDRYAGGIEAGATERETRRFFGPTKIGLSLFYLIR